MKQSKAESGFTLVEIIAVLIILSIVAIVLCKVTTYCVQSYVFARNADQLSQKAQLALARLNRELTNITAVSFASADQIDYTSPKNPPSCTLDEGCQYSIKRTGTQITLERTTAPVVAAQVLIDGLAANNGGNNFLSYFRPDETAWTIADGFSNINSNANYLAKIQVRISLDFPGGGKPPDSLGTINPRANGVSNAPLLN